MTHSRAESIRVMYPLFQAEEGGSIPTSALQMRIFKIDTPLAVQLNRLWHSRLPVYDTGFCIAARVCYAAVYDDVFYAVAIWSNPVAAALPQHEWLELKRFAIADDAPKNTASRMLAVMVRLIRCNFPEVVRLISYQDVEAHSGTIYRAAGWIKDGEHRGGSWSRPNAVNTYTRTPRTRPDRNGAIGPKIRWAKTIRGDQ